MKKNYRMEGRRKLIIHFHLYKSLQLDWLTVSRCELEVERGKIRVPGNEGAFYSCLKK